MKRILTLAAVAAVSLAFSARAHAQVGVIAGLTSSSTSMKTADDVKAISLYHAGLTYKFDLGAGFAIQPSVLYQVKGSKIGNINKDTNTADFQLKTGYVELPVALQWGPDLMAFRPFVFAEPFIGYAITSSDKENGSVKEWAAQAKNKFEYGFGIGGGVELAGHVQLSAQYFNNLGSMFDASSSSDSSFTEKVKNFKGIKVSLAILF